MIKFDSDEMFLFTFIFYFVDRFIKHFCSINHLICLLEEHYANKKNPPELPLTCDICCINKRPSLGQKNLR